MDEAGAGAAGRGGNERECCGQREQAGKPPGASGHDKSVPACAASVLPRLILQVFFARSLSALPVLSVAAHLERVGALPEVLVGLCRLAGRPRALVELAFEARPRLGGGELERRLPRLRRLLRARGDLRVRSDRIDGPRPRRRGGRDGDPSVARTWRLCAPWPRPVRTRGDEQGANAAASTLHSNVTPSFGIREGERCAGRPDRSRRSRVDRRNRRRRDVDRRDRRAHVQPAARHVEPLIDSLPGRPSPSGSLLTWAGVSAGFRARTSAAAPATCGVAIDVPFRFSYSPAAGGVPTHLIATSSMCAPSETLASALLFSRKRGRPTRPRRSRHLLGEPEELGAGRSLPAAVGDVGERAHGRGRRVDPEDVVGERREVHEVVERTDATAGQVCRDEGGDLRVRADRVVAGRRVARL